ncbi:ankyrin repeat domain-containing protein 27-like [Ochlerotatus camptorhynchus]|uniref:ankyrin repeat domain-containing protein 27-like n=1 Tax=Ochlerotatus camptorhynchus TaxID=644619 RepID=UPI0031D6A985
MDVQYDEDLSQNPFYRKLQTDHQIFLETAPIEGWIICVPRSGTINDRCLVDQEFLLAQILVPNEELPETHFTNLSCVDIRLHGRQLITGGIQATILFEEVFYTNGLKFKVWCIERPLCDTRPYGIIVEDEFGRLTTIKKLQDAVEFIRSVAKPRYVFSKIDTAVQSFMKNKSDFTKWNLKQYKEDVKKLYIQCLEIVLQNRKLKDRCQKDAHLKHNVKLAVETYMMDKLYDHVKDVINVCQQEQVESFNKTIRNLSDIHITEMKLKRSYADVIPIVKKELLRIDDCRTAIDKSSCLKKAFEIIAREHAGAAWGKNNGELKLMTTTDDVIPLLIFVITKTGLTNWIMNVTFLKEFQLNDPSSTVPQKDKHGQNNYLITTLEAVIVYISCCSIERSQRLGIDIMSDEDIQMKKYCEMSFKNADQFLNYLFTLMKNNEEEEILNIFQDFNNNNSSLNFESKNKKCHPLCSCMRCESMPYLPHIDDRNQNGLAAIHLAATLGSPKLLTLILNLKPNVDAVDAKNWTALHYAAANGHQNLLLLLLHAGININSTSNDQHTSLHLACLNGHSGCVKALLYFSEHMKIHVDIDAQTQLGQTALHYASKWGFSDIVETLLEHSATVNVANRVGATPLKYAHNSKIMKMLKDAYADQQKRRKSSDLSPVGNEEYVLISDEDLLDNETFVEYRNIEEMKRIDKAITAIVAHDTKLACYYLGLEVFPPTPMINTSAPKDYSSEKVCHPLCTCQRCLNDSADFYTLLRKPFTSSPKNTSKINLNATNGDGCTALHVAAMSGNLDMINILLDHRVSVSARTKSGCTALHLACRERRLNVIKLLLSRCRSDEIVDLKDCRGDTPLHYAVEQNQLRIVEILLSAKADKSLRNLAGQRPIDIARERLFFNVINVLERKW